MNWWRRWFPASKPVERGSGAAATAGPVAPAAHVEAVYGPDRPNALDLPAMGGRTVFDPSLKHCEEALRETAPVFEDAAEASRWWSAQAIMLEAALRAIAASPWRNHLVLRGSAAMPAWVGDAARRPGDLDWVVLPFEWHSDGPEAARLLDGIVEAVTAIGSVDGVSMSTQVARDDIWTYERADGKRLTFSWSTPGLPPGKLQCDVVFREEFWVPPAALHLPTSGGAPVSLLAATPEQSLAWKILWLMTDIYPQGKDLYDAVLLAERFSLPEDLVERMAAEIRPLSSWRFDPRAAGFAKRVEDTLLGVAWDDFAKEYPWLDPTLRSWVERFEAAAPMRSASQAPPPQPTP